MRHTTDPINKTIMKITLEFNDTEDALDALNGQKYKLVLNELNEYLRTQIKHNDKPYDEIQEELLDLIHSKGLTL